MIVHLRQCFGHVSCSHSVLYVVGLASTSEGNYSIQLSFEHTFPQLKDFIVVDLTSPTLSIIKEISIFKELHKRQMWWEGRSLDSKKNNHYKKVSTKHKIRFSACKEKLNTLIKLAIIICPSTQHTLTDIETFDHRSKTTANSEMQDCPPAFDLHV